MAQNLNDPHPPEKAVAPVAESPTGVFVQYGAAGWINHVAGTFLIPAFLFPTGALVGDYMEGRVSDKIATAILGIVSALVAAFGSIVAALLS